MIIYFVLFIVIIFFIFFYLKEPYMYKDENLDRLKKIIFESFYIKNNKVYFLLDKHLINKIKLISGKKSYTIRKKYIFICMKDKEKKYYNDNQLIYVILHEIAHVMNNEIGHTNKFFKVFNSLLLNANRCGIYDPNIPKINNYCKY